MLVVAFALVAMAAIPASASHPEVSLPGSNFEIDTDANLKRDLLSFHVYREAGTGSHPGFLNLAWSRVSEPSGTTLMDFEFNQSSTTCATGPNVVRTAGDLLIEYAIDQGGSRADITARR